MDKLKHVKCWWLVAYPTCAYHFNNSKQSLLIFLWTASRPQIYRAITLKSNKLITSNIFVIFSLIVFLKKCIETKRGNRWWKVCQKMLVVAYLGVTQHSFEAETEASGGIQTSHVQLYLLFCIACHMS